MADTKDKSVKPDGPQSGIPPDEQGLPAEEQTPAPKKSEPDMRPGNRGVPSVSLLEEHPQTHPGALSPGQYAEIVVGYSDADPGSDEANEHGEKFAAAKRRRRMG